MQEIVMVKWVRITWCPILGYNPKVRIMMNSWFSVHFMHEEDYAKILKWTWVRGRSFMQLLPWHLGFNPVLEAHKN